MKFKGLIAEAMSGKLAAVVASHNRGGTYFRRLRIPPSGVPTEQQQALRNAFRGNAPSWQVLTPEQRAAWNVYGQNVPITDRIGNSLLLSGFNWYAGSNSLRQQTTQAVVSDAPSTFDRGSVNLSGSNWQAGETAGTVTFTAAVTDLLDGDSSNAFAVYQGRDFSPGRKKYFGSYQLLTTIPGNSTAGIFVLTTAFPHNATNNQEVRIVTMRGDGRYDSGQIFPATTGT